MNLRGRLQINWYGILELNSRLYIKTAIPWKDAYDRCIWKDSIDFGRFNRSLLCSNTLGIWTLVD